MVFNNFNITMFILLNLFISACFAGATVQEGVLDVYIQEIPAGLKFTVTRTFTAENDGWFAVGLKTREGNHYMTKSTVVVAGRDALNQPTVKTYNPEQTSVFQTSWETTGVIDNAMHTVSQDATLGVLTFTWKNKVKADVVNNYLIWAYNSISEFDITDSVGHQQNKGVLVGDAVLPLFAGHDSNTPTLATLNAKVATIESEIDGLESEVEGLKSPHARPYGDVTDPTVNVAVGARVDVSSCSTCTAAKGGFPSVLTDGNGLIPRSETCPNKKPWNCAGFFSTSNKDKSPRITVTLAKAHVVSTIKVWFKCDGNLNFAKGLEGLVEFNGNEQSCGTNAKVTQSCGTIEFTCNNKLAERVILRKTSKYIQITEIEVNAAMTVRDYQAQGGVMTPAYAPKEYEMEDFVDRSMDVYYGDVVVLLGPSNGPIYQKTAEPCVTEEKTKTVSGAYRHKAVRGEREAVFTFAQNNCENVYTIHANEPAKDLVTESFAVGGGSAQGAQGMTQVERDLLNAATEKNTAQEQLIAAQSETITSLKDLVEATTQSLMATEMSVFRTNDGSSGIRKVRARKEGTQPFLSDGSIGNNGAVTIHDHPDHHQTAGMGEVAAVLNGVKFTTMHNDYKMKKPTALENHTKANKGLEDIAFPPVPESVSALGTVAEQVDEMREYFRAFHYQDTSIKDYREHFKPVLCYLEGAWMIDTDFEAAFVSDRHEPLFTEREDQWKAQEFMHASGKKDPLENVSFLPTKIANMVEDMKLGVKRPQFAHWKYRIACQDFGTLDLPTARLGLDIDDNIVGLHSNSLKDKQRKTAEMLKDHRGAHFRMDPRMPSKFDPELTKAKNKNEELEFPEGRHFYSYLDTLMEQVPGKDGPGRTYTDNSLGNTAKKYSEPTQDLNTAFYSRMYSFGASDAMGVSSQRRGWSDLNMFSAMTENESVAPVEICKKVQNQGKTVDGECWTQRWTYAIPLEIIYLTPLYNWNPCRLQEFQSSTAWKAHNRAMTGRANSPYEGFAKRGEFVMTPTSLFGKMDIDSLADTGAGRFLKCLTNPDDTPLANGKLKLESSGIRILSPLFSFVNPVSQQTESKRVRMRYPIFPIYEHTTLAFREARALRELRIIPQERKIEALNNQVCNLQKVMTSILGVSENNDLFMACNSNDVASETEELVYTRDSFPGLTLTLQGGGSTHTHDVECDYGCFKNLKMGNTITIESELWDTHDHTIKMRLSHENTLAVEFRSCYDGTTYRGVGCADGHNEVANFENEEIFKYTWRD